MNSMLFKFRIKSDDKSLEKYSTDASIFRIVPRGVFVPKDREELLDFVREVIDAKNYKQSSDISITSRAAGTCMSGGSLTQEYMISFTENLNNIKSFDIENKQVVVESGMYYRDFEKETLKHGLFLPSYPASRELCAIGGMIGNNSAGEKTLKYGKTSKYVEEIEMICADGNIYNFKKFEGEELNNILENDKTFFGDLHRKIFRLIKENKKEIENNKPKVTKNSSGYYLWDVYDEKNHSMNLAKLIVGSQGTLGVMTQIKLKLVEHTEESKMAVVFLKDLEDMPMVVEKIKYLCPDSFEVFDDHTFKIAMKFLPQMMKRLGGNIFGLIKLFWPEMKIVMSGHVPKIVMLVEFVEKDKQVLKAKINSLENIFEEVKKDPQLNYRIKAHIVKTKKEAKKYWIFRRESFNLLRSKLKDERTVPFIEDVVVKSDDLPTFLPKFEKILDDEKLTYTIAGHVGDGNIHVIPLMKLKDEKSINEIEEISHKVYELVREYHGSLSGEHNDGLIRAPFLNYMFTDKMIGLFKEVKNIFDPQNIFNPNKKIGVTWGYAKERIDRRK